MSRTLATYLYGSITLLLAFGWSSTAQAIALVNADAFNLRLGGYARTISGVQQLRLHIAPAAEQAGFADADAPSGLHAGIVRLEWNSDVGDAVSLQLQNRLAWRVQSSTGLGQQGAGVGLGVSGVPGRTVDTRTTIVDDAPGRLRLQHEIDRFALRLYLDAIDLTIGRQAITWGNSNIFLVADLWTNFSPFELDTAQKPGIDAARGIVQLTPDIELDLVLAGRQPLADVFQGEGDWTYLSVGARTTFFLPFGDVYTALAKHWDLVMAHAGFSANVDTLKIRGEITQAFDYEREAFDLPRATVGLDWFSPALMVSVEAHMNGIGTADAQNALDTPRTSRALARGETYLLGRYYLGTSVVYTPWQPIRVGVTALGNVTDPSVMLTGFAGYSPSANIELSLGAFAGLGERPNVSLTGFDVTSEYGTYGELYYFQMAAFF